MSDLDTIREKILRAGQHVNEFRTQAAIYLASNRPTIVRQFEQHIPEKSGRPGLTWRARVETPPPVRLGVIAGDVIHNLRSALDHLARGLVVANGGTPRDEGNQKTQFPIVIKSNMSKPVVSAKSGGISCTAQAILEAVQPYDRRQHPLSILHRLSNIDKHRTLLLTNLSMGRVVMHRSDGGTSYGTRSDVKDGTVILWILEAADLYHPETQVEADFSPDVLFDEADRLEGFDPTIPAGKLLVKLVEFTRESVIQRFARACLGGELRF